MKILLSHEDQDLEVTVSPRGEGYIVSLQGHDHLVEGRFGGTMRVRIDHRPLEGTVRREGADLVVRIQGQTHRFRTRDPRAPRLKRRHAGGELDRGEVHAPMPGLVVDVLVTEGLAVEAGQPVLVVEAMKMQNALAAPISGTVAQIKVAPGAAVDAGQLLVAIRPEEA